MFAVGRTVESEKEREALCAVPAARVAGRSAHEVRMRHGPIEIYVRLFEGDASHVLKPQADLVHFVIPVAGSADVIGATGVGRLAAGQVLLVGQEDAVAFSWRGDTAVMVLDIPRTALQAHVFAAHGEPRRLSRANLLLGSADSGTAFGHAIQALCALQTSPLRDSAGPQGCVGAAVVEGLAAALRAPGAAGVFPIAASVKRAVDRLAEEGPAPAAIEDLARAAGVVPATLRRSVRATTGLTLARLVEDARLEWARKRLSSNLESRPLAVLAAVAGYAPVAFTRAYRRRFGETPTQTRARTFSTTR